MDTHCLHQDKLWVFDGSVGRELFCEQGVLWLTLDGEDVMLRRGESWKQPVRAGESLLVQAMAGDAMLCVSEAGARPAQGVFHRFRNILHHA